MKNYQKPMALIEKIDVMDVITTSGTGTGSGNTPVGISADIQTALGDASKLNSNNTIVFEW